MASAPYVVVVGGSQGVGLEIARCHLLLGFDVVIIARRQALLERAASEIEGKTDKDRRVCWEVCDARNVQEINAVFSDIVDKRGTPRLCYFMMGQPGPKMFAEMTIDDFEEQMNANYATALNCARAMYPLIPKGASSGFVFASSFLTMVPLPGFSAYTAAKSAVLGLAYSLRCEFAHRSISVSCLVPTAIDTPGFAEEVRTCRPELIDAQRSIPLLNVQDVAREAVDAALRGRFLILPGWRTKLLHALCRHFPDVTGFWLRHFGPRIEL